MLGFGVGLVIGMQHHYVGNKVKDQYCRAHSLGNLNFCIFCDGGDGNDFAVAQP